MDLGLTGKAALITGGSKGIGKAIAIELAREGANVAIAARGHAALAEAGEKVRALGTEVLTIQADLCTASGAEAAVTRTAAHFGRLDILINNVGDSKMGHDWQTSDDEWASMLDQSLLSMMRCCRAAIPHLLQRPAARIINIASVNGHQPPPGRGDYNAAKAGALALSKTLSLELAPKITVNAVCPARIDTPLWHRMAESLVPAEGASAAAVLETIARRDIPMGRFGQPEEVAAVVALLASERAGYITGAAYNIDGGYTKAMA